MAEKKTTNCCIPVKNYQVEALVSVDERGQMVLPKELREKAEIHPGDKFALTTLEREGKVCCLFLIKAAELNGLVRDRIEPLLK
jgi:antitoxin PrlF